jgi:PhnB protein
MKSRLNPYINFRSTARPAMEFYQSVFGGKLTIMTFKDFHAAENPSEENLIMHSMLETENGMVIMAADVPERMELFVGNNIHMMLGGDYQAELTGYFDKLSQNGTITMPLKKEMWGDIFGAFEDQFGVHWMVNISGTPA